MQEGTDMSEDMMHVSEGDSIGHPDESAQQIGENDYHRKIYKAKRLKPME